MGTMIPFQTVRIVRDKNTSEKFLVQYIDPRAQLVYTWGHVVHYKGLTVSHERGWKSFSLKDVELDYVVFNIDLVKELFAQTLRARASAGHVLVRNGERTFDMGPGLKSTRAIEQRLERFKSTPPPMICELRKIA